MKKQVSFDDELIVREAPCYDRRPKNLKEGNFRGKSREKMQIELNIYKYQEMTVHPQSKSNTAFFNVRDLKRKNRTMSLPVIKT